MSTTIRFIAIRCASSFIANLTLFLALGVFCNNHALGQSASSASDGTLSPQLAPLDRFLVKEPAASSRGKLVDLQQFRSTRNLNGVQIELSDSQPVLNVNPQNVSQKPILVAAREFWQDDDRGSKEVNPQELIEKIRQPLPDQPMQRLTAYPESSGEIKQFSKEPEIKDDVQFPERYSREYFGQEKAAGPWILEYDFALNSPVSQIADYRSSNGLSWVNKYSTWASPNARSYPLYFEQTNMERYGNQPQRFANALSAAHFFGTIPLVPFKMGNHPLDECMYTLGHLRPGSCNPSYRYRDPITGRAIFGQAIATGAVIAILP